MAEAEPDIVIHMAAQALVRPSYEEPVETFATNVMGTVHVLEAARQLRSVQVILNVTSDKCYENNGTGAAFREGDRLGGDDPSVAPSLSGLAPRAQTIGSQGPIQTVIPGSRPAISPFGSRRKRNVLRS
jgi:nucleoside-diphosphate-sugar epimerase